MLAARRGEIVGKDELHAAVWGDIAVTEDSLVQCIGDIRRALGAARDALQTVPRRGYRLDGRGRALPRASAGGCAAWRRGASRRAARRPPRLATARRPRRRAADGPVVAVLPFENLSAPGAGTGWRAA